MAELNFNSLTERFLSFWDKLLKQVDEEGSTGYSREKIIVFVIALVLAICFWLMVNLSRPYVLNLNLPIQLGNIPEGQALTEDLPEFATVSIQGEGWQLLNLYNNPPQVFVDVTDSEVSLFDQVQQQMNALPDLDIQQVQPLMLNLELEERISKRVPVQSRIDIDFSEQFDITGTPVISPDSITISGAASIVENISFWETDSVQLADVRSNISSTVNLRDPGNLLETSSTAVQYTAEVAEFTEGESRVYVRARNMPAGDNITFSPASILVRYSVPIEEYTEVNDLNPFTVFVPYNVIEMDSTGFVVPRIQVSADQYDIRIESHTPQEVSYFEVLGN